MNELKPGDHVYWTNSSRHGRRISMTAKEGTIESIDQGIAKVRYGKKSIKLLPVSQLSLKEQPTDIDRMMAAVRHAAYGTKE